MLDYLVLENSTEFPAFFTIFYTVILAFILSSLVAFTHYKTSRDIVTPLEFLQSLVLVSIVTATVMQAIGDSLARGLGMLGALAIIRYRTTLKAPRNMVFTFAALASGIACGVYAFIIALTGTIGFCLVAFALRFSPLSQVNLLMGNLSFSLPIEEEETAVEQLLSSYCKKFRKEKFQFGKNKQNQNNSTKEETKHLMQYNYQVSFTNIKHCKKLYKLLLAMPSLSQLKVSFENINENV